PETRNPKPKTRNPKPETRNPKPETRNPKPETRNHEPSNPIPKMRSRCCSAASKWYSLLPLTSRTSHRDRDPEGVGFRVDSDSSDLARSRCCNVASAWSLQTQNPKPETRNPKP
ncbi:hypothetical protein T484DRAFT_1620880, partial [Baffinella frigidus]